MKEQKDFNIKYFIVFHLNSILSTCKKAEDNFLSVSEYKATIYFWIKEIQITSYRITLKNWILPMYHISPLSLGFIFLPQSSRLVTLKWLTVEMGIMQVSQQKGYNITIH